MRIAAGGVDTGWTFYTPFSTLYSNSYVVVAVTGVFIAGFSSILTGLNFIVTIHQLRAPGLTWYRLPLFIWSLYATSVILVWRRRCWRSRWSWSRWNAFFGVGIFDPKIGGDPLLFQHLFWFYSHPAVYIMILPGMGVVSELISCFSRKEVFGYKFVAWASLAIAAVGFLVWGHHMFVTGQSLYGEPRVFFHELHRRGAFRDQGLQLDRHPAQGIDIISMRPCSTRWALSDCLPSAA